MSLSRHWNIRKKISSKAFGFFLRDCEQVLEYIGIQLKHSSMGHPYTGPALEQGGVRAGEIRFDAHRDSNDTFCLVNIAGRGACKTASKPYDICVAACLVIAKMHFGDKGILVYSDYDEKGLPASWSQAVRMIEEALPFIIPVSLVCNEEGDLELCLCQVESAKPSLSELVMAMEPIEPGVLELMES